MKKIFYLIILLAIPMNILADSYSSLWKKVDDASKKDLPKTQILWLNKIIAKAEGEKGFTNRQNTERYLSEVFSIVFRAGLRLD